MKWVYKLNEEQLKTFQEMQKRYLAMMLAKEDRCKWRGYIKHCYKTLNAIKLALQGGKAQ